MLVKATNLIFKNTQKVSVKNSIVKRRILTGNANRLCGVATPQVEEEIHSRALPKHHAHIPGPKRYPIVKCIPSLILHKDYGATHLQKFWGSLFREYGPIVKIYTIMAPPMVGIWKPEDIEAVYRNTTENPVRLGFLSLKKVRDKSLDNFFEQKTGILSEDSEEWKRVRAKVQTPMLRPKNLIKYLAAMDNVSLDFVDKIYDLRDEKGEMPSNFLEEIYKWALESVSVVALNRRLGCLDENLANDSLQMKIIREVNETFDALNETEWKVKFWKLFPTPAILRLQKVHDKLLSTILPLINEVEKEAKENQNPGDSETLMETLFKTPGLTRKDVITMVLDMLTAGIDTTSHAISFALYLLAKNPEAQKKLQEELDSVLGDGSRPITESDLAKLSYLKMCVKESFRLFPLVLGIPRVVQSDLVLSGYTIPKGWITLSCNMITTRKEEVFPRPDEFIPERWGREKPLGPIHPYASLPFSHGTRMCIGRRIAEQEIYTLLARLIHRYDIKYNYKDMGLVTRLVSLPTEPLKFEINLRK